LESVEGAVVACLEVVFGPFRGENEENREKISGHNLIPDLPEYERES
jgi:hypothetical protein